MPRAKSERYRCIVCQDSFGTSGACNRHISSQPSCEKGLKERLPRLRIKKQHEIGEDTFSDDSEPECAPTPPPDAPEFDLEPDDHLTTFEEPLVVNAGMDIDDDLHIEHHPKNGGRTFGRGETRFEVTKKLQDTKGLKPWAPFSSVDEWGLAKFLSKLSHAQVKDYLSLNMNKGQTSLKNDYYFTKAMNTLPQGTSWVCETIKMEGDVVDENGKAMTEELELFYRDPVEVIKELISNPLYADKMCYAPRRVFVDQTKTERIYNEMWTGDLWWELQDLLPEGATVVPVILSSDKTQLSTHSGDKSAWPLYLTIGNIDKATRRQPSKHATCLLGYLPVTKLQCFTQGRRPQKTYSLFHQCVAKTLQSLRQAGEQGVRMVCGDGFVRHVYPILAAYVADHPEQCLVVNCKENRCPKCPVPEDNLDKWDGNLGEHLRDPNETLKLALAMFHKMASPTTKQRFKDLGVRAVIPFWARLPFSNIHRAISPDILHQLHKGIFKDHLFDWCRQIMGDSEMDARFMRIPDHPWLNHFSKGVCGISQWTGNEYKNMAKVFLGVIYGAVPAGVIRFARGVLDFIYYAHYTSHSTKTLEYMTQSLQMIHDNKQIFIDLEIRTHFNFPKFHSMLHYISSIHWLGTADGYNTEAPERLHIDYCKEGYRAGNKRNHIPQMVTWLQRQENVVFFDNYLRWAAKNTGDGEEEDTEGIVGPCDVIAHLPKRPPFPQTPADRLLTDWGARTFLPVLTRYLKKNYPDCTLMPTLSHRFDIYKRVTLHHPSPQRITEDIVKDAIRAVPETKSRRGARVVVAPSRFDTVLVHERSEAESNGIDGLRVARIRVIFMLPPQFQHQSALPLPLLYIQWYTRFRASPQRDIQLFIVKPTMEFEIIELSSVRGSCHLLPLFGKEANRSWNKDNVLNDPDATFFVNQQLSDHSFQVLV